MKIRKVPTLLVNLYRCAHGFTSSLVDFKGLLAWAESAHTDFPVASRAKFMEKSKKQVLVKCKKNAWVRGRG